MFTEIPVKTSNRTSACNKYFTKGYLDTTISKESLKDLETTSAYLSIHHSELHLMSCNFCQFSTRDTNWVRNVFRQNKWKDCSKLFDLEKDHGFRLFVPQRDLIPGQVTFDQIEHATEKSRRIIFVISRYTCVYSIIYLNM